MKNNNDFRYKEIFFSLVATLLGVSLLGIFMLESNVITVINEKNSIAMVDLATPKIIVLALLAVLAVVYIYQLKKQLKY